MSKKEFEAKFEASVNYQTLQHVIDYDSGGHCTAFIAKYGNKFIYLEGNGWLIKTPTHYAKANSEVRLAIKNLLRFRRQQVRIKYKGNDDINVKTRKELSAKCSVNSSRINDISKLLQDELTKPLTAFNKYGNVLNCLNGVVDLDTGDIELHKHATQIYYFTYVVPTNYNPLIKDHKLFKKWVNWLSDVLKGNEAMAHWLQKATGYTFSDTQKENVFFYLLGLLGRNGKGTFTETVENVMARITEEQRENIKPMINPLVISYAWQSLLENTKGSAPRPDTMRLYGAKMALVNEMPVFSNLSATPLRDWTGREGSPIVARALNKEPVEIDMRAKFWIDSNSTPFISNDDKVTYSRLRLIEWPLTHVHKEDLDKDNPTHRLIDKDFKRQWMHDNKGREAVLYWIVQGAVKYSKEGLSPLKQMRTRIKGINYDSDYLAQFLEENNYLVSHSLKGKGFKVSIKLFKIEFNDFLISVGAKQVGDKTLKARLVEMGMQQNVGKKGIDRAWGDIVKFSYAVASKDVDGSPIKPRELSPGDNANCIISSEGGEFIKWIS